MRHACLSTCKYAETHQSPSMIFKIVHLFFSILSLKLAPPMMHHSCDPQKWRCSVLKPLNRSHPACSSCFCCQILVLSMKRDSFKTIFRKKLRKSVSMQHINVTLACCNYYFSLQFEDCKLMQRFPSNDLILPAKCISFEFNFSMQTKLTFHNVSDMETF